MAESSSVQVVVRLRPLNSKETKNNALPVVTASSRRNDVTLIKGLGAKAQRHAFHFDRVFNEFTTQEEVFKQTLKPIVADVLRGYESTVFAYGQTGTGKTYTMEGVIDNEEHAGTIPRSCNAIFEALDEPGKYIESSVTVSYLEIYNEELSDLLVANDGKHLKVCEDKHGVQCMGLSERKVNSAAEILAVLKVAQERRSVAETNMNKASSRSHCLFSLTVCSKQSVNGGVVERKGKMHLVDLAGSECAKSTGADANSTRLRESQNINKSLLTLGRVITALKKKAARIPYRDSKLTRLLQEALGGRSRTCIIATVSPSSTCAEESLSTLKYAEKAQGIENKPIQAQVRMQAGGGGSAHAGAGGDSAHDARTFAEMEQRMLYMETRCEEAQAALGRKHDEVQQVLDRAEAAEKDVGVMTSKVESVTAKLQEAVGTNSVLMTALQQDRTALEQHKVLVSARTKTETALRAEAGALLGCLEAVLVDRDGLQSELLARAKHAEAVKAAAQQLESDSASVLAVLGTQVQSFCQSSLTRLGALQATVTAANEETSCSLRAMGQGSGGMLQGVQLAVDSDSAMLTSSCDELGAELTALVASSSQAQEEQVEGARGSAATTQSALAGLQGQVQSNKDFLLTFSQELTASLVEAHAEIGGVVSAHSSRMLAAAQAQASSAGEQTERLSEQQGRFEAVRAAVEQHLGALQQTAATTQAAQDSLAAKVAELVPVLTTQQSVLEAALQEQKEVGLVMHQQHEATLQGVLGQVQELSRASLAAMADQLSSLQQAAQEHKAGGVPTEALQQGRLREARAVLSTGVQQALQTLTTQAGHLEDTLKGASCLGSAPAAEARELANIQSGLELVQARTKALRELLGEQKQHLETVVSERLEGAAAGACQAQQEKLEAVQAAAGDRSEQQGRLIGAQQAGLRATLAAQQAGVKANADKHSSTIHATQAAVQAGSEEQLAIMRVQQAAMASTIARHKEAQEKLVGDVMTQVQQLLSTKMDHLDQLFSSSLHSLQQHNSQLQDKTTSMQSAFASNVDSMVGEVEAWVLHGSSIASQLGEAGERSAAIGLAVTEARSQLDAEAGQLQAQAEAWRDVDMGVAAELRAAITENAGVATGVGETSSAFHAHTETMVAGALAWAKLDTAAAEQVLLAAEQNAVAVEQQKALQQQLGAGLDGLSEQAQAWGASNASVDVLVDCAVAQNQQLQATQTATEATHAAAMAAAAEEAQALAKSHSSTTALAGEACEHGKEAQVQVEATQAGLSSQLLTAAEQVQVLQAAAAGIGADLEGMADVHRQEMEHAEGMDSAAQAAQQASAAEVAALQTSLGQASTAQQASVAAMAASCDPASQALAAGLGEVGVAVEAGVASLGAFATKQAGALQAGAEAMTAGLSALQQGQQARGAALLESSTTMAGQISDTAAEAEGGLQRTAERHGALAAEGKQAVGEHQEGHEGSSTELHEGTRAFCQGAVLQVAAVEGKQEHGFSRDLTTTASTASLLAAAEAAVQASVAEQMEKTTSGLSGAGGDDSASAIEAEQQALEDQENLLAAAKPPAPVKQEKKRSPKRPALSDLGEVNTAIAAAAAGSKRLKTTASRLAAPEKRSGIPRAGRS